MTGSRTRWGRRHIGAALVLVVAVGCSGSLTVDRTDDDLGASACFEGVPNDCSLRGAILNANRTSGPATIVVPAGTYPLTLAGPNEDSAESGDLDVTDDVTIQGVADSSGARPTIGTDYYNLDRVFDVDPARAHVSVVLTGLEILGALFIPTESEPLVDFPYGAAIANFGADLTVDGTWIRPGLAAGGAGIYNEATLRLTDSVIGSTYVQRAMPSTFVAGAAIANGDPVSGAAGGAVTIERSRILGVATYRTGGGDAEVVEGGAIYNGAGGTMVMRESTIDGSSIESWPWLFPLRCGPAIHGGAIANRGELWIEASTLSHASLRTPTQVGCESRGGALFNAGGAALVNVTLSGNRATESGGAIHNVGTMALAHVSVLDSVAGTGGPGDVAIAAAAGSLEVASSLIANGCAGSAVISDGGNLETPGDTCGFDQPTDLTGVADPRVAPLADDGGPTWTHALLAASPAIDLGIEAACLPTDQRGVARTDGACDTGAYEYVPGARGGLSP